MKKALYIAFSRSTKKFIKTVKLQGPKTVKANYIPLIGFQKIFKM